MPDDIEVTGSLSSGQMRRITEALKSVINRRIHQSTLVKLARSQWFPVERVSTESDGHNIYLRLTLKFVIGKSDERVSNDG